MAYDPRSVSIDRVMVEFVMSSPKCDFRDEWQRSRGKTESIKHKIEQLIQLGLEARGVDPQEIYGNP